MKTRWAILSFLLAAAVGVAQDKPASEVTLACKPSPPREKPPRLTLAGTADLPDGTVLKITLQRQYESLGGGGKLGAVNELAGGGLVEVKGKKFQQQPAVPALGGYSVAVQFLDDYQKPAVKESLKGKMTIRTWQFQFPAWGDDLVPQLGPKLTELVAIATECLEIVKRVEKISGSESSWIKEKKNVDARGADLVLTKEADEVVKDTSKLMARLDRADVKAFYPAAHQELFFTIRNMHGNAQHFNYEAGKFAGAKSYHSGGDALKTHRLEPFNFDNLKKYVENAPRLAGREFALWIVKDLKRTGGLLRQEIVDALRTYGPNPGISFIADRLAKATASELDALETELRAPVLEEKKDDKKDEKKPDPKPDPNKK